MRSNENSIKKIFFWIFGSRSDIFEIFVFKKIDFFRKKIFFLYFWVSQRHFWMFLNFFENWFFQKKFFYLISVSFSYHFIKKPSIFKAWKYGLEFQKKIRKINVCGVFKCHLARCQKVNIPVTIGDSEHDQKSAARPQILLSHCRKLLLAGRVEDCKKFGILGHGS